MNGFTPQFSYTAGVSNNLEVLDAQQQLFPAENALSQARLARLLAMVQFYAALGGGWNLADPASGPTRPFGFLQGSYWERRAFTWQPV